MVALAVVAGLRGLRGSWHAFQPFRRPRIRSIMTASAPPPLLLTPIDNLMSHRHVPKLLFFPESPGSDVSTMVKSFRDGLSKSLEAIPTLSGTLRGVGQKGALCVAAPWSKDLRHERGMDYRSLRDKGFPVDDSDKDLLLPMDDLTKTDKSVLLVQINIVKGGIIIALCTHHNYTDGSGSVAITSVWAACCRGDDISPWLTREMMDRDRLMRGWGSADVADFPLLGTPPSEEKAPSSSVLHHNGTTGKAELEAIPQGQEAIFFFPKHNLAALKVMASKGKYGEGGDAWISTSDALNALLGCCIHATNDANSRLRGDKNPELWFPVNVRRILDPPLPAGYIGNALFLIIVSAPTRTMESTPAKVAEIAHLIRKQIKQLDERSIRKAISALPMAGDAAATMLPSLSPSEEPVRVTSWAKLGYYDLDWGYAIGSRIERVRYRPISRTRFCAILPELKAPHVESKDCGLEVVVATSDIKHMERLKQNELFMRFAECRCN